MRHGLLPYLTDNVMIRKIFAAVLLLTEISGLAAEPYYSFDFDASSETPLAGWICRGSGKTPKKTSLWSDYFHDGGDAYQVLSFPGVADAAYSNSNTEQGGKVDDWLKARSLEPAPFGTPERYYIDSCVRNCVCPYNRICRQKYPNCVCQQKQRYRSVGIYRHHARRLFHGCYKPYVRVYFSGR